MNNDKPNSPRYFRLLEKGETTNKFTKMRCDDGTIVDASPNITVGNNACCYIEPVTVDPWISYAEQKPTKEDFLPTKTIHTVWDDGTVGLTTLFDYTSSPSVKARLFWRRITPPTPAKPKSAIVELRKCSGLPLRSLTVNQDGTAQLDCGDIISAESIEQFIQAREEVMK